MLRQLSIIGVFLMVLAVFSASAAVKFIEVDDETGGDWSSKYGSDGYIICAVKGPVTTIVADAEAVKENDVSDLPNYIDDYTLGGGINGYVWQAEDLQDKILEQPDGTKTPACWFSGAGDFTFDLPLQGVNSYTLAIYIDDWENGGREESLTIRDLDSGDDLVTEELEDFGVIGKYAVFEIDRSVQVFVHYIPSYGNAVVSGVFFSGGLAVDSEGKLTTTWGALKQ